MPFIIQWQSEKRGIGHGPLIEVREIAEELCRDLNEEFPELKHEVIELPEPAKETEKL